MMHKVAQIKTKCRANFVNRKVARIRGICRCEVAQMKARATAILKLGKVAHIRNISRREFTRDLMPASIRLTIEY